MWLAVPWGATYKISTDKTGLKDSTRPQHKISALSRFLQAETHNVTPMNKTSTEY